jgi:hypothetical protein
VIEGNVKAGMKLEKQTEAQEELGKMVDNMQKRAGITVHALALNMAPSVGALRLEKTVEELNTNLSAKLAEIISVPGGHVTKEQLTAVDKGGDQIFEELKTLPKLSREEVQKEYDDYPEENVLRRTHL